MKTQRLYREIKSVVQEHNIPSTKFSKDLSDAASAYRDILKCTDDDPTIAVYLQDIDALGANILMPIVLSIMQDASPTSKGDLLHATITTYIRHSVIGGLENSKLENTLHPLAQLVRNTKSATEIISRLRSFAPSDAAFEHAFSEAVVLKQQVQRYILRQLEQSQRVTKEMSVNAADKVHVEHIYPQTPQHGHEIDGHDNIVNRLGNLTLLDKRLNLSIKNAEFARKRDHFANSDIMITKRLRDHATWDLSAIINRQKEMASWALKIWNYPSAT